MKLVAPRILKAPAACMFSHLAKTGGPSSIGSRSSGVRRAAPAMRRAACSMALTGTSLDMRGSIPARHRQPESARRRPVAETARRERR